MSDPVKLYVQIIFFFKGIILRGNLLSDPFEKNDKSADEKENNNKKNENLLNNDSL